MPELPSQAGGPPPEELDLGNPTLRAQQVSSFPSQQALWSLLADAGLHLQIASAATKAAVSSLLDHGIVWDASNQHEFLQTIDASTDQVDRIIRLLTLAFQLQAGRLKLRQEPSVLPEILAAAERHQPSSRPRLPLELRLPSGGHPVLADDEYLTLALELLFELFVGHLARLPLRVRLVETPAGWQIVLSGLEAVTAAMIVDQFTQPVSRPMAAATLAVESQLRLVAACGLLKLQGAEAWVSLDDGEELNLQLPAAVGPTSAVN